MACEKCNGTGLVPAEQPGIDPEEDPTIYAYNPCSCVEKPRNRQAEQIVDAVGAVLGVDTGTCSEERFTEAVKVVEALLKE